LKSASECFLRVERYEELARTAASEPRRTTLLKLAKSWRLLGELATASEATSSPPATLKSGP
jgi:hypothetical protein